MTAALFRRQLQAIVPPPDAANALRWPNSESDYAVEVVRYDDTLVALLQWLDEGPRPGTPFAYLNSIAVHADDIRWEQLRDLFADTEPDYLCFERKRQINRNDSEVMVLILRRFDGMGWVGVKGRLIQT